MKKRKRLAKGVLTKQRKARYSGKIEAKKIATKNWIVSQKRVAAAIAAMKEYYGDENFHVSNFTSEELLDLYDKIYVERGDFPELNQEEIDEVNRKLEEEGVNMKLTKIQTKQNNSAAALVEEIRSRYDWRG